MDEQTIFGLAIEKENLAERDEFLDQACAGDDELRRSVDLLLRAHQKADDFLEEVPAFASPKTDQSVVERPGTMIGPYMLHEEIGEGGMGSVFLAIQKKPVRRKVALKVIKPGMDSKQVITRFEAERQALAIMDHPNIAKVHEGGTTKSGHPYFVMELVRGIPITDYADRHRLTTNERLNVFSDVCNAVQHAHQKGVIHRDLKPSNILVTVIDGRAIPKVIDFGIAKATRGHISDNTSITAHAQMVGTPVYMSPEQADVSGVDVDTRSDVYSLGVLLYELLTGTTPFDRDRLKTVSYDEFRRIVREEDPPRPSTRLSTLDAALDTVADKRQSDPRTLTNQVSGELDWIVMKSLEKDRARRYRSAHELVEDIQRYLEDEPVKACPPTAAYRLGKVYRRNRTALLTAAVIVVTFLIGSGIATWQSVRATAALHRETEAKEIAIAERQVATEQRDEANRNLYGSLVGQARTLRLAKVSGFRDQSFDLLTTALKLPTPVKDVAQLRQEAVACMGDFVGLMPMTWNDFQVDVCRVAVRPRTSQVAIGLSDGSVLIRDLDTGDEVARLQCADAPVIFLAFDNDGVVIASGHDDGAVDVWRVDPAGAWKSAKNITIPGNKLEAACLTPDGTRLLVSHDSGSKVTSFDLDQKSVAATVFELDTPFKARGLAFSADGTLLATRPQGSGGRELFVWDVARGRMLRWLQPRLEFIGVADFSADGSLLVCGCNNGVGLFDLSTDKETALADGDVATRTTVVGPDKRLLACVNAQIGSMRLWDIAARRELAVLTPKVAERIQQVAFSPNGKLLVGRGRRSVHVWKLDGAGERLTLVGHQGGVPGLSFNSDGTLLASTGKDGTAKLWNALTGELIDDVARFAGPGQTVTFSPNGRILSTVEYLTGNIRFLDVDSGREVVSVGSPINALRWFAVFSPDGRYFAACGDKGAALWSVVDQPTNDQATLSLENRTQLSTTNDVTYVQFSPDGKLLAWRERGKSPGVYVWDIAKGERRFPDPFPAIPLVNAFTFSPDSSLIMLKASDGTVAALDTTSGEKKVSFAAPEDVLGGAYRLNGEIAISPNGRWLAGFVSSYRGQAVVVWDVSTREFLFKLPEEKGAIWRLTWSPDGHRLAIGTSQAGPVVWDVSEVMAQLAELALAPDSQKTAAHQEPHLRQGDTQLMSPRGVLAANAHQVQATTAVEQVAEQPELRHRLAR